MSPDFIQVTLDKQSKTYERDVQKFREELRALEKKVAPAALIVGAQRRGHLLEITVLPAVKAAPKNEGDSQLTQWREF